MGVEIRTFQPEHTDEWLAFMDGAFPDNVEWAGCYCAFYDDTHTRWDTTQPGFAERNRANRRATIQSKRATGLMAIERGQILGWVNAAPREFYANLRVYADAIDVDDPPTGSIMCYVVSPDHRGRGVASALLAGVDDHFRTLGLDVAEAYPLTGPSTVERFTTSAYKGTRGMYEAAGYTPHRDINWFTVMRKSLT